VKPCDQKPTRTLFSRFVKLAFSLFIYLFVCFVYVRPAFALTADECGVIRENPIAAGMSNFCDYNGDGEPNDNKLASLSEYTFINCVTDVENKPPYELKGAGQKCCIKKIFCNSSDQEKSNDKKPYLICDQIPKTEALAKMRQDCIECVGGTENGYGGIWTAIGCIPREPEKIVSVFLRFGLGMGGGVALLMILGAGFILSVSQGDPKQTDTAKQWLTSAIAGLLFIIFSVTILQFIGYNIFQIPGFGG